MSYLKKIPSVIFENAGVVSIAAFCLLCYFYPAEAFSINARFMLGGELWRLPMAMFMHNGVLHLVFNMFALLLAGSYLERRLGTALFLSVYFTGGVLVNASGGFFLVFCRPLDTIAGASTGIYSALGVLIIMALTDKRETLNDFSLMNMCASLFYLVAADIAPASITTLIGHTLALGIGMLAAFGYNLLNSGNSVVIYSRLILTLNSVNAKIYSLNAARKTGNPRLRVSTDEIKNYDSTRPV